MKEKYANTWEIFAVFSWKFSEYRFTLSFMILKNDKTFFKNYALHDL